MIKTVRPGVRQKSIDVTMSLFDSNGNPGSLMPDGSVLRATITGKEVSIQGTVYVQSAVGLSGAVVLMGLPIDFAPMADSYAPLVAFDLTTGQGFKGIVWMATGDPSINILGTDLGPFAQFLRSYVPPVPGPEQSGSGLSINITYPR